MRQLIAGNWKMNGLAASLSEARDVAEALSAEPAAADVLICPPATLVAGFAERLQSSAVAVGGQDCHAAASGAHTGDISAEMLRDAGARFVIVGHSERRADHRETDEAVRAKARAALRAGLTPIVCVGETEAERDAGRAEAVVAAQLDGSLPTDAPADACVIAYEPVWAIGTGRTPTLDQVCAMHSDIRVRVGAKTRILYGGSVKPANAAELLGAENVDGALVGGASLKADDFLAIIRAAATRAAA